MPRYQAVKIDASAGSRTGAYYIDVTDDDFRASKTLALGRALPDLDIFQATLICDALNREDNTSGDTLVAIIDRAYDEATATH